MDWIVYKWKNLINGKHYIGQTKRSLKERTVAHWNKARLNKDLNNKFFNALRKYPEEYWKVEVVVKVSSLDEVLELEKFYVQKYDSYEAGYNSTLGGEGTCGYKLSDERKATISKQLTGRPVSDGTREKIASAQRGSKGHNYGKAMLPEVREALCKANTGRVWSEESKCKASGSRKGYKPSKESIEKMRKSLTGKKQPKEVVAKRRASLMKSRNFATSTPWEEVLPDGTVVLHTELTRKEYAESKCVPTKWFYDQFKDKVLSNCKEPFGKLVGYKFRKAKG